MRRRPNAHVHRNAETQERRTTRTRSTSRRPPSRWRPSSSQNEPQRLKQWQAERLYEQILAARANSPKGKWVLHDGPPFANGDIHIGHLINKTLKDVVLRFRTMQGYQTPYVPGLGLPRPADRAQDPGGARRQQGSAR